MGKVVGDGFLWSCYHPLVGRIPLLHLFHTDKISLHEKMKHSAYLVRCIINLLSNYQLELPYN